MVSDFERAVPSFALYQALQLISQALPFLPHLSLLLDHHLIKNFPSFLGDYKHVFVPCILCKTFIGTVLECLSCT